MLQIFKRAMPFVFGFGLVLTTVLLLMPTYTIPRAFDFCNIDLGRVDGVPQPLESSLFGAVYLRWLDGGMSKSAHHNAAW
jgi:hypothetical protein